ncbi:hypothetical protein FNV43_RR01926 [Rhamnella rubrinervis]|uniref:PCI domain-containing protein n=1 Tax=Rhamnella rubrinervis TaxID=2594499 RepID=A0A8K0HRW4_9ROSA|nr:hypothetical protein FNV43_RR01926 [Rhamnella rubrinervis]
MRGFGDHTGPLPKPVDSPLVFGNPARPSTPTPPFSDAAPPRSPSSIESGDGQRSFFGNNDAQSHENFLVKFVTSNNYAKVTRFSSESVSRSSIECGDGQRSYSENNDAQSPQCSPVKFVDSHNSATATRFSSQGVPKTHLFPPSALTPDLASKNNHPVQGFRPSMVEDIQPSLPSPVMGPRSNFIFSIRDSQAPQRYLPSAKDAFSEAVTTNPISFTNSKRTRSPSLLSVDQASKGNSFTIQDDSEREIEAKAKRLARFKVELGETRQSCIDVAEHKVADRNGQSVLERDKITPDHSMESVAEMNNTSALSEYEGLESSGIIIGLCADMCPESERAERERKGDLDQYERFDGDRNQTSKHLAVKKYTRTAEREANLIRPMPILQMTVDYLLNLLDRPYSDRFLGTYNFLWDRMRAIRMDLRMQHIFNQGAITMLEQMIRLHIIAMHELCEYPKGEGFSEGFDAHLNIEQMNKTSVELFQLYDDHRKKGMHIPTEKEFRGYYALLKLDKHPGYTVEPAEFSLDLAKMTPQIRLTAEVMFARKVSRACGIGNYISFFRLARKASYLQACLMHAHFAKLRTQALAFLHAGLQNNQGIPIANVAEWLAMEEEDLESLLEYHGFLIKIYNEPYMVKEGPFLNFDKEYPTRRSKLVDLKRSGRIIEDVLPSTQVISIPLKAPKETQMAKNDPKSVPPVERESSSCDIPAVEVDVAAHALDEEMPDSQAAASQKEIIQMQPTFETPVVDQQSKDNHQMAGIISLPWGSSSVRVDSPGIPKDDAVFRKTLHSGTGTETKITLKPHAEEESRVYKNVENSVPQIMLNQLEDEVPPDLLRENDNDDLMENDQYEETAEAKLKLIIRLWKRRSSKQRELREQRQVAANAALQSLSIGPPIYLQKDVGTLYSVVQQPSVSGEFDIDQVLTERCKKHEQSRSILNVSEEILGMLSRKNPDVRCLCWKLIICSHLNNPEEDKLGQRNLAAGSWLLSKLMPSSKTDYDAGLVISSAGLSIWKKCVPNQSVLDLTCCWSVVKDADFNNLTETLSGASAVLFIASESISWKLQKDKLHNLLLSIPSGSCLPLLILSDSYKDEVSDLSSFIINELGLHDVDQSRISCFRIVFLVENQQIEHLNGFFSDKQLREGLQWLASESPQQPVLHYVRTRELVLTHLNSLLEVLKKLNDFEIDPNDLIQAFNKALDQSLGEISTAAEANHTGWPCPEISILEFCEEFRTMESHVPKVGWSEVDKIQPIISALEECKLPTFSDDLSCLASGSNSVEEIENNIVKFKNCLVKYLTEESKMMGLEFASKEAHVLLQRSCRLEHRGSLLCIVPNWVNILRRILNWRLMGVTSLWVYILNYPNATPAFDSEPSSFQLSQPSLDELIEVSCSPLIFSRVQPQPEPNGFLLKMTPNSDVEVHEDINTTNFMEEESSFDQGAMAGDVPGIKGVSDLSGRDSVVGSQVNWEADRLSMLLDKCNMVQNMIDQKLFYYH